MTLNVCSSFLLATCSEYIQQPTKYVIEKDITDDVTAIAVKRVIAWHISESMKAQNINKTALASRMNASRATLDRLLNADDTSLTLATLSNVANALGKKLKVEFVDDLAMA